MKLNTLIYHIFNIYGGSYFPMKSFFFLTVSAIWSGVWQKGEEWMHAEAEHRTRQKHLKGPFPDLKRTPAWNRSLLPEGNAPCGPTLITGLSSVLRT